MTFQLASFPVLFPFRVYVAENMAVSYLDDDFIPVQDISDQPE